MIRRLFVWIFLYVNIQAACFKNTDEMLLFVKKILPEKPIILEAGGHYGEDTLRMYAVFDNATIHVFEPLPSSYKKIKDITCGIESIKTYPFALSNFEGMTNFYVNYNNDGASSIGKPVNFNEKEFDKKPIKVSCTTINAWAKKYSIERIDFMWLDMEGHELSVLKNADIIDAVKCIYTEIDFVPVREDTGVYIQLRSFLEKKGFQEIWRDGDPGSRFGNALFIHESLLQ